MHRSGARRLCAAWIAWAAIAGTPSLAAQQTLPGFSLADVLGVVLKHNPEIAAAAQQRAVAEADTLIARAYPNPEVGIGSGSWRPRLGQAPEGTIQSYTVTQAIELPSVRDARSRAAGFGVLSAEATAEAVRNHVGFQARAAFSQLLRRQEEARLAAGNVDLLSEIFARVRSRVEAGEAPRFELVRAESEQLSARTQADAARLKVEEARALLRRLAGNALPPQFEARGQLSGIRELPVLAFLQNRVLEGHPSLRSLMAEHDRARARLDQERALRAPQPTLSLTGTRDPELSQMLVGVSLPLPLWNRREGQIAQALASIDLALTQMEAQRAQLLGELDAAYARVSIAQRQIETLEGGLLKSAEAALRVAEAAWRFGERSFLEVLDAQRTLRGVRNDYNQAIFDYHAAWIEIERLQALDPFRPEPVR